MKAKFVALDYLYSLLLNCCCCCCCCCFFLRNRSGKCSLQVLLSNIRLAKVKQVSVATGCKYPERVPYAKSKKTFNDAKHQLERDKLHSVRMTRLHVTLVVFFSHPEATSLCSPPCQMHACLSKETQSRDATVMFNTYHAYTHQHQGCEVILCCPCSLSCLLDPSAPSFLLLLVYGTIICTRRQSSSSASIRYPVRVLQTTYQPPTLNACRPSCL